MTTIAEHDLGIDLALWQGGLTLDAFVKQSDTNQEELRRRMRDVALTAAQQAALADLHAPRYVLAVTESWCGDSLMNLPILARIVEALPHAELRLIVRSQAPDLTAAYAARAVTNIPIFSFFDADFREIGTWVERSAAAHARIAQWRADNPALEAIQQDTSLTQAEKLERIAPVVATLRPQMEQWYADTLQAATVAELTTLLRGAPVSQ